MTIYDVIIPEYIYKIKYNSIGLELYRHKLLNIFINHISDNYVKTQLIKEYKKKKFLKKAFAKFIFNLFTNKTYNKGNKIILDDVLFNIPTNEEVKSFYEYLNDGLKNKNINLKFSYDQFNLLETIKNFIEKIKKFKKHHNKFKYKIINNYVLYYTENKKYSLDIRIYNKLKNEYTGDNLHKHILIGLIRYDTLDSGAEQYVVDLEYKKKLNKYGMDFECFGSMFNHYYSKYCSMFYDVEKYFGSYGSFFGIKIKKGMFMANPPYDVNLLIKMYLHIKENLNGETLFIMSYPDWDGFILDKMTEDDKLYTAKKRKYDYFMDPLTFKMVKIPPYITQLYCSKSFDKNICNNIKNILLSFENMKVYGKRYLIPIQWN